MKKTIDLRTVTFPMLHTSLPGPKAKRVVNQDKKFFAPCNARPYPLVIERGLGSWLQDVDGNVFLDCTAGIAVNSTGHCHPEIVSAIQQQAEQFIHMSGTDFYYQVESDLCQRLCELVPSKKRFTAYLCNSGAEAIEACFKLARFTTRRPRMLAFSGAFHGRTMGALSLTSSKYTQREGYAPLVPGVTHVPYPDTYRPPFHCNAAEVGERVIEHIEECFERYVPAKEVAAIFFEPIQGEGGYVIPPKNFFKQLRKLCDRHGILMVCDEVQAGIGRTGKMFAHEHFGFEPDMIVLAKGLASGMPLGACLARADLMKGWPAGAHGTTFGGNPLSCAAALKTLDLVEKKYMKNARTVGAYMMKELQKVTAGNRRVGEVRGKGLMIAVDFVKDKKSREGDSSFRDKIVEACFQKGLLVLGCGSSGLRFSPSLSISKTEVDVAVKILSSVLKSKS